MNGEFYQPGESQADAFSKDQLVEFQARAVHDSDRHESDFSGCRDGCWETGKVEVDKAIADGRLLPVDDADDR